MGFGKESGCVLSHEHDSMTFTKSETRSSRSVGKASTTDSDGTTLEADSIFELEHGRPRNSRRDLDDLSGVVERRLLRRNFRALSTFSFAIVLQASWEFLLLSFAIGFEAGNTAGVLWSTLWTMAGFTPVVLSLAELSSMLPTAGGQFVWIGMLAPAGIKKPLSFLAGWQSTLAWQSGAAAGSFLFGGIIQEMVRLRHPEFDKAWQGTALVLASVLILLCINIFFSGALPVLQNVLLLLHLFLFVALMASLWILTPHRTVRDTFIDFRHAEGWPSTGISVLVGQVFAVFSCLGSDAAAHMAEEVKHPSTAVPRAMFWSYTINSVLGLAMMVSFGFVQTDEWLDAASTSPYMFIHVFHLFFPHVWQYCLIGGILCILMASNVGYNASTARQTWAFARDNGLFCNGWLARVDEKRRIPTNAIIASAIVTCLLSLINIGSKIAFNAIVSLNAVALLLTYAGSIACVLYRRLAKPDTVPKAEWSLGRLAVTVNVAALAYISFALFWTCWPTYPRPTLATLDWSSIIFVLVLAASAVMYTCVGRHHFQCPQLHNSTATLPTPEVS